MTKIILGQDDLLAEWAESEFPECAPLARPLTAIGFQDSEGKISGVAIFHNYRHYDVEISFISATPRWATPGNMRVIFDYAFNQLGCVRMSARTSKKNKIARKTMLRLGAVLEGVHPFGYDGKTALCTYGLYKDKLNKRWL